MDSLRTLGYQPAWRVLQASDFGVPQLCPRFILIAMRPADMAFIDQDTRPLETRVPVVLCDSGVVM